MTATQTVQSDAMPPWSERRADDFALCRELVPEQHPGLSVVAVIAIRMAGRKPTREAILDRLRASGRELTQLKAKGWV